MEHGGIQSSPRQTLGRLALAILYWGGAAWAAAGLMISDQVPLRPLGLPEYRFAIYCCWCPPVVALLVWLALRRSHKRAALIVPHVIAGAGLLLIAELTEWRVSKKIHQIPVSRWLSSDELDRLRARTGFPVFEQQVRNDIHVLVANDTTIVRANEEELRAAGVLQ
jgi:hypothetical protein